ncbi:MAG: site-specific DNA-methyltransferase [Thaumarchaeota archaeon]|nr:site-specific DNA-methyltransferase [Nitrososphaerota archaeon]
MSEFVSELEKIMKAVELNFDPTPGFGKYKKIMPEEAIAHPAKFNTNLVEFLIKKFTKEGETILDPMAGTGVLGVIAALYGRNAIPVELESKFYKWMEKARENVERLLSLTLKGWIVNICGDARELSELLGKGQTDTVITSPPYADAKKGGEADEEKMAERWDRAFKQTGESWDSWGKTWKTEGRKRALKALGSGYSNSEDNIGNLPVGNIDAIITSPPYEAALEGTSRHTRGGIASRDPALAQTGTYATRLSFGVPIGYSPNKNNIGNLKSSDKEYEALRKGLMTKSGKPTYLSEMLKVYREMWKVLKPGGRAVVVVKPFIRNKRVIDLPYHTYLLMRLAGFELEQLYKLRLKQQSFWRILYEKKYPEVPKIRHEYIIVEKKK